MTAILSQFSLRRLGRRYSPDPRDANYRLNALVRAAGEVTTRKLPWKRSPILEDQSETSECCRYALVHRMQAAPYMRRGMLIESVGGYRWMQEHDEIPGEGYDGTTVRAAMEYAKMRGWISAYYWAWKLIEANAYLLRLGPLQVGTDWFTGMDEPNRRGIVSVSGAYRGGHSYVVRWHYTTPNRWSRDTGFYLCDNSWGMGWSPMLKGSFLVPEDEMQYLIEQANGEMAAMVETKPTGY
jgi:hypothetical protein